MRNYIDPLNGYNHLDDYEISRAFFCICNYGNCIS